MSIRQRPAQKNETFDPSVLRKELEELRTIAQKEGVEGCIGISTNANGETNAFTQSMRDYDRLTPCEKQVANLGVHPDAFRPLKQLNEQHFAALRKANALSPQLEADIKAYSAVAGQPIA
jgi:hypothetical protein